MLCSKTIPPPTHSMDKANNVLIANPMQICAPTLRTKIDYKSRSCDSRQSKFDKTLNQIPDLNKANYVFFLARARGEWGFSVAKMWPAFYVTLEKQSVETWDLFWDARSRAAHMISNNRSGSCWPDPGVHLYFQPSKKNEISAICAYESNLKFFFNFAISRGTWKINQARSWTGEYFIGQTSAVLTLSHQTAR